MSGRTAFGVNLGFKKLPGGIIATTGPLKVEGDVVADSGSFAGPLSVGGDVVADDATFAGTVRVAGGVVADGAPIRAAIDGPVTISTFGDSTNNWYEGLTTDANYPSNKYHDRSSIIAVIPEIGPHVFQLAPSACPLFWASGKYRYTGQGGISGESTSVMLARQAAAAAPNRKALQDIAAVGARVAVVNGLSINDLQGLDVDASDSSYNAMMANCREIIRYMSETHEFVVWTGIFGFHNPSYSDARNDTIRAFVRRSQDAMQAIAAEFRNVSYIHPVGLTCDSTGQWIPGMYMVQSAYLHLSEVGAGVHGNAIRRILDARYDVRDNAALIGDSARDWFNLTDGEPANVDCLALGSATLGERATARGVLSVPFATTSDADRIQIQFNNLLTWISGGVSGDKYRIVFDYDLLDSNGAHVDMHQVAIDTRLLSAAGTATVRMGYCATNGKQCATPVFELDRDVSAIASGAVWWTIKPMRGAGSWTLKMYPPKVRKL